MRLTTIDAVLVALSLYGGRGVTGTKKLRSTLSLLDGTPPGSPSEVDLLSLLRTAPIPTPVCQLEVPFPEGDHAFPDLAWPDRRKCVEIDGFDAHGTFTSFCAGSRRVC